MAGILAYNRTGDHPGIARRSSVVPVLLEFYLGQVRAGMAQAGREPDSFDLGLRIEACISDNGEAAFAVMRRRMAARFIGQYPHWAYLDEMGVSRVTPAASIGLDTTSMLAGTASRSPASSDSDPTGRLASRLRGGMGKEFGAGCQIRTGDLMLTRQLLYQLS